MSCNAASAQVVIHTDGQVAQSGAIATGTSSVEKTGTGTFSLNTAQSYTGGTTISAGALQLTGTATLVGNVFNNSKLILATSGTVHSNNISGTGSLVKQGASTIYLTGNNTFTGGTSIEGGTMWIGNGVSNGSLKGNVQVANMAQLGFNNTAGNNTIWNDTISGAGSVAKNGLGTLTVTNDQTYTGSTVINNGVLAIGAVGGRTGGLASANISAASGTELVFNRVDDTSFGGRINATGGSFKLTKNGAGELSLNNYAAAITLQLNEGTVIANGGLFSDQIQGTGKFVVNQSTASVARAIDSGIQVGINNGGILNLGMGQYLTTAANIQNDGRLKTAGSSVTLSGNLSGNGVFEAAGTRTVLSGNNTFAGTTLLSSGVLELRSTGALGTSGAISFNGGTLEFSAGNKNDYSARIANESKVSIDTAGQAVTFATGLTGSSATFVKTGAGTLTFTGANTYLGKTTVAGGKLAVGDGGTSGALASSTVTLNSGATLEFNRSDASTFGGIISGPGTLVKQGAGMLQLRASNSFTGKTEVLDGELRSAGLAVSAVRVAAGAILTGNDRVGALNVEGLLNAAAGIGKLTAASATFAAGSIFRWELGDAAGAAGTGYDTFATTGAITFGAGAARKTIQLAIPGVDGKLLNFDTGIDHSFTLMTATLGLTNIDLAAFDIDASGLGLDSRRGSWTLSNTTNMLMLNYIATLLEEGDLPEPATALMFLTGLAGVGASLRRHGARKAA